MITPRLVALVGPTASGKTALALALAERLGAEIVSADSRQVYRGLDIGTAKPTWAERRRVPHHGLDLVAVTESFDAARFRAAAMEAIADIHRRGRAALVVGGTGLWVRVLLHGLCPAPPRVPALRRVLHGLATTEGSAAVHRRLSVLDPAAAERIHPHDTVRAVRALEVTLSSGRRLSDWQRDHGFGDRSYEALTIGLAVPVRELDARIAERTRAMLAAGFLEEVRGLRAGGVALDAPAWRTVGYREMLAYVEERSTLEDALAATVLATRRFARRQRTWFRGESDLVWRDPARERARITEQVAAFLAGQVAQPQASR